MSTPPLKILHVVNSLANGDGITAVIEAVCRNLDRTRFSLSICCLAGRGDLARSFEGMGIRVYALNAKSSISPLHVPRNLWNLWRLARLLRREKFAIVHSHEFFAGTLGRLAASFVGVPVILLGLHNKDAWKGSLHIMIDRWLAARTDKIVANSEATKQFAVEHERIPAGRFVVIHNGIDLCKFSGVDNGELLRTEWGISPNELVVGTVGRLTKQKGLSYLIKAAAIVHEERSDVRFVIVGPDGHPRESIRDDLVRLVKEIGLEHVVMFTGGRTNIPQVISTFDLFVLATLWEGFGLAVAEAMAMKRAVVATRVDALPEVVEHGVTGVLVPPADEITLAAEILRLLDDHELRLSMGAEGRKRVEAQFGAPAMTRRLEELYESLTRSSDCGSASS